MTPAVPVLSQGFCRIQRGPATTSTYVQVKISPLGNDPVRPIRSVRDYYKLLGSGPLRTACLLKFLGFTGLGIWGLCVLFTAEYLRGQIIGSTFSLIGFSFAITTFVGYPLLTLHNRQLPGR